VANSKLVGLILDGWEDFDRVLDGLAPEDATRQVEGQSAPAWTLAHTTELVDRWINVGFQGLQAVAGLGDDRYRRGSAGSVESGAWDDIRAAVAEVRQAARAGLESLTDAELEGTFPYVGGSPELQGTRIPARYALMRIASHDYFHIGVIACQRDRLGHAVGDYPGLLASAL